ncbi:hypothetical protein HYH03_011835 [Edaphochlamys debaryana]|uniref:GH16 domain-containing protein n=1 Tax=Edaphochlamys debaryana TaxID=47281 RepID=A0A835XVC0_9CHLO|nr:hypothetical protein HYH03_011835 [Edaphochlamys debaryana]|eukprot:KAG2489728.1 hypothetical protein HYH03_011835 [Edaphochlamys debaryana]
MNNGINLTRFGFELGDGTSYGASLIGWGNWQRQCHTNASTNVRVEMLPNNTKGDGMLVIQAAPAPDGYSCYNPNAPASTAAYTSARVITRNKAAWMWSGAPGNSTPVRIDIRLRVPQVNGTWASAWMLPDTTQPWCMGCSKYGNGWCLGGEIDLMEHINTRPVTISNLRYGGRPDASWLDCKDTHAAWSMGGRATNWNTFSVIWDSTYMSFIANGKEYKRHALGSWYTGTAPDNKYAPFDVPFYLIFDLAVGGLYPGFNIDNAAVAEGRTRMEIDWIKVYDIVP